MSIPRGTTPTFTLTFEDDVNFLTAQSVYVTFKSGIRNFTKTVPDIVLEEKKIKVYLTQRETFMFEESKGVEIQANWITATGDRVSSEVAVYAITKQLLERVI